MRAVAVSLTLFVAGYAAAQDEDPDTKRLAEYRLTDEGLQNFAEASRNLAAAFQANPDVARSMEVPDDASIQEMAAVYDSNPALRSAIESSGMTSAEYITFMFSMMQAGMAAWLVEEYGQDKLPEGTPRENVDYYFANKEQITALTEEMQAMGAEGGD